MFTQELLCTMCTCTAISILLGASVKKKNPCLGYFSAQWVNGIVAQDSMQNPLIWTVENVCINFDNQPCASAWCASALCISLVCISFVHQLCASAWCASAWCASARCACMARCVQLRVGSHTWGNLVHDQLLLARPRIYKYKKQKNKKHECKKTKTNTQMDKYKYTIGRRMTWFPLRLVEPGGRPTVTLPA